MTAPATVRLPALVMTTRGATETRRHGDTEIL